MELFFYFCFLFVKHRTMKGLIILVICIFGGATLKSQPLYRIEHFGVENGMQQDIVSGILQDKKGMMWFSTYNGLSSYDGYSFKTYKYTPGQEFTLSNNRITEITESAYDGIWCKTYDRKVFLFNPGTESFYNVLKPFEQAEGGKLHVDKIFSLRKGVAWIICDEGHCYRVDEARYAKPDGIKEFRNDGDLLKGRRALSFFQDSEGDEWILTDKGVSVLGKAGKQFPCDLPYMHIVELNGSIYLVTARGELLRYDLHSSKASSIALSQGIKKVNRIFIVRKNLLALATDCGVVLYVPDRDELRAFSIQTPEQSDSEVTYIYEDRLGELWLYTTHPGIVRLNIDTGEKQYLYTSPQEVKKHYINRVGIIFEDSQGTLWLRPNYGNFSYYDRKTGQICSVSDPENPSEIFNPIIRLLYQDRQGNCWLVGNRGMKRMSVCPSGYTMWQLDENHEQRAFFKDNHHRLWVASKKEYVRIYTPDHKLQGYLSPQGEVVNRRVTFGNSVYSMCRDREGDIWLAIRNKGLVRLTEQSPNRYLMRHYTHDPQHSGSLSDNSVFSVFCDGRGQLWVGTYNGGLNLVRKEMEGEVTFIHAYNRLKNYPIRDFHNVRCITETSDSVLLVGTANGLISFSGDFQRPEDIRFYRNTQQNGTPSCLTGNDVINIYETSDRTVYVLTFTGGINKILSDNLLSEDVRFRCYSRADRLGSDMVYSMIEDDDQKLWVTSEYILSRFDPYSETFENYSLSDLGFKQNFSEAAPFRCENGRLLFATNMGVLEVQPTVMKKSDYTPRILFTNLQVGNRKVLVSEDEAIEIQPNERNLRVDFAALDYSRPENIRYAYRLKGLEEEWNYSGKNRHASYLNLAPGKYTLQVKSTNSDGVLRDNVTTLNIHVIPTFWETPWAWLIYLLFIILTVSGLTAIALYIYRLRHHVNMEQKLANIKLRFFTDISHELRTPLTLIAGPVTEMLEEENISPDMRRHLTMVHTNTEQMLNLVNQILDFRKIQNNKMKLLVEHTDLVPLLESATEKFRFVADEQHIALNFSADAALSGWVDRSKVEMMFSNLLSNAFKYTHTGKAIHVSLQQTGRHQIAISVADEGIGIAPDKLESIFYRFETLTGHSTSQPSSGIGLSLVKRLVELHHGTIRVNSKVGIGSEFVITLPIDKVTYEQDTNAELIFADGIIPPEIEVETIEIEEIGLTDEQDTILVVEDNAELRSLLKSVLRKQYRVLEACNGEEGAHLAAQSIPDMIISDIMMPVMDGLEMVRCVKENKETCHALIVLLSAKAALDDRITALEQGVDDYITKPFSSTYLKARVASLFNRRKQLQEQWMQQLSTTAGTGKTTVSDASWKLPIPEVMSHNELFMKELMEYIEEQMDNSDLTIDEISDHLHMSRSVFNRKLKSIVGMPPVLFIQEIRMKRAAQLLATQNYNVSQVAYMVGFGDPRYFNRCFKKHNGLAPGEYQKKQQQKDSIGTNN